MLRRVLRRVHLWLALSLGVLIVLLGLSGSVLVYRAEIDRALNPNLWQAGKAVTDSRLDAVVESVAKAYPDGMLRFVRLPAGPSASYEAWIQYPDGITRVYIAPDGTTLLGARGEHAGLIGILDAFHNHLFIGGSLEHVLGLAAAGGLIAVLSGVTLWWPRRGAWRKALRVRLRGHWLKTAYDLHRVVGVVTAPLLLLSFVTGLSLIYHETSRTVLVGVLGGPTRPDLPRQLDDPAADILAYDRLLSVAKAAMPGATATWVVPGGKARPFLVRFRVAGVSHPNGNSYVALHPASGDVLLRYDATKAAAGERATGLRYPLHIGTALGAFGKPATAVLGAMPAILFFSGVLFWWRRRHPGNLAHDRGGTPRRDRLAGTRGRTDRAQHSGRHHPSFHRPRLRS
jgi:uncharacterized iron-regulated membrane protein